MRFVNNRRAKAAILAIMNDRPTHPKNYIFERRRIVEIWRRAIWSDSRGIFDRPVPGRGEPTVENGISILVC